MEPVSLTSWALLGVAVLCLLFTLSSAVWLSRATPSLLARKAQELEALVLDVGRKVEAVELRWESHRAELAAFLEEASDVLNAVERKRRRAAASASRAEGAAGNGQAPPQGNDSASITARARAAGIDI